MTRERSETAHVVVLGSGHSSDADPSFSDIDRDFRRRGAFGCGAHFVITRDGTTHLGRPLNQIGCVAPGYNAHAIFVCLAGGMDDPGDWSDNYSQVQREALRYLLTSPLLTKPYPGTPVRTYGELIGRSGNPGFLMSDWEDIPRITPSCTL